MASSEPTPLVADWDVNYSSRDDVLELRGSPGWLRTKRLFLNFRVDFEFKAITPDAEPGVFVRTWVSPNEVEIGGFGDTESAFRVRRPAAYRQSSTDADDKRRTPA